MPVWLLIPDDAGEDGQVGHGIDQHVEQHGRHALGQAADETHDQVAGLRDGAEGHEPLDVVLHDGDGVAERHGHGGEDRHARRGLGHPAIHQAIENLEHEGQARALGRHRQVGRNRGRRPLIDIRRPEMERHDGQLETDARPISIAAASQKAGMSRSWRSMAVKAVLPVRP